MNNTFNLQRFTRFFIKHTLDHAKTYLLSTIVLVGVLFVPLIYVSLASYNGMITTSTQMGIFMFCGLVAGTIFTSLIFADLSKSREAIPALTLPVSTLEKYLVAWLYSYVIFQVIYIIAFYSIDSIALAVTKPINREPNQTLNLFSSDTPWYVPFMAYLVFHAIVFWGAIVFKSLHLIKSAFVFFVGLLFFNFLNKALLYIISGGHVFERMLMSDATVVEGENKWSLLIGDSDSNAGLYIFIGMVILLWVSAFFKLKEKEV